MLINYGQLLHQAYFQSDGETKNQSARLETSHVVKSCLATDFLDFIADLTNLGSTQFDPSPQIPSEKHRPQCIQKGSKF